MITVFVSAHTMRGFIIAWHEGTGKEKRIENGILE